MILAEDEEKNTLSFIVSKKKMMDRFCLHTPNSSNVAVIIFNSIDFVWRKKNLGFSSFFSFPLIEIMFLFSETIHISFCFKILFSFFFIFFYFFVIWFIIQMMIIEIYQIGCLFRMQLLGTKTKKIWPEIFHSWLENLKWNEVMKKGAKNQETKLLLSS